MWLENHGNDWTGFWSTDRLAINCPTNYHEHRRFSDHFYQRCKQSLYISLTQSLCQQRELCRALLWLQPLLPIDLSIFTTNCLTRPEHFPAIHQHIKLPTSNRPLQRSSLATYFNGKVEPNPGLLYGNLWAIDVRLKPRINTEYGRTGATWAVG